MGLSHKTLLLVFCLLLTGGCATVQPPVSHVPIPAASQSSADMEMNLPEPGTFVRAESKTPVGFAPITHKDLLALAQSADYILLGEVHTNACDHAAQAAFLDMLGQAGIPIAVGLEMVPQSQQAPLNDFNNGRLSVDQVPDTLHWEEIWGYDFTLYRPIFENAALHGQRLYGLNLPQGLARKYGKVGLEGLSSEERAFLPDPIITAPEAQRNMLEEHFKAHMSFLKKTENAPNLDRFIRVQSAWDTTMASQAARLHASTHLPVAVIVGNGHVEFGYGIAHRLKTLDPQGRVLLVLPWRGHDNPDPNEGDVFFYCPMLHSSRLGYTLSEIDNSLHVVSVASHSPADQAGLMANDVIVRANSISITSLRDLHAAAIASSKKEQPLVYTVRRGSELVDVTILP